METWDVVVVGGGGAGLAAALTLSRAMRRTLVIDGGDQRNRLAVHSHGILGFDGTSPTDLVDLGRDEIVRFGGEVREGVVTSAIERDGWFVLETARGDRMRSRHVVVSTGVRDELPSVRGVAEHWGRQVVICPYCDGWEVRGRPIGILATGPKSIFQAQLLRQWSDQVTLFANDAVTLSESERVELAARGIPIVEGAVDGIDGAPGGALLVRTPGRDHACDAIFTAPRPVPNDAILTQLGARSVATAAGPFVEVDAAGATSIRGLWAAGNIVDPSLKVSTAVGNGMAVGTHVNEALVREDVAAAVAGFTSELIVRPRAEDDMDALVSMLAESHRTDRYPLMAEHVSAAWLTEKGSPAWVAELGGAVVGHAAVAGMPAEPLELTRLVVSPAARGAGVAAALLEVVERHATSVGSSLFLEVLEHNSAAIRLYERRGWLATLSEQVDWFGPEGPQPVMRRYVKS